MTGQLQVRGLKLSSVRTHFMLDLGKRGGVNLKVGFARIDAEMELMAGIFVTLSRVFLCCKYVFIYPRISE